MNQSQAFTYDATQGLHHFHPESFRVWFLPDIRIANLIGVEPGDGTKLEKILSHLRNRPKNVFSGLDLARPMKMDAHSARSLLHELWKRDLLNRSGPHDNRQQYRYWAK